MPVRISEARLNDLVYMALKRYFFEPMFGEDTNPRECDIRVCMDMVARDRITPMSAILLPDEVAGRSHQRMYDVDTSRILDEVVQYMEDHWLKRSVDEAFGIPGVRDVMRSDYEEVLSVILEQAEEDCARTVSGNIGHGVN